MNDKSNLQNGHKQRQQTSSQLDMVKIQSLFANAQDPGKQMQILLLLKALKNRFSKLKNPFVKRQVVVEYSRHDICGVTPQKYYIQKKLLVDGSQKIRQLYLRLTSDIAYDLYGIHYLTKSDKLIENLLNVLKKQIVEETASKKFILAILQRFSYPIKSRKKMVEFGIVPLIFKVFESQKQSISIYTLQYLTAMIMNLSLQKTCLKHFIPYKQELISTMINLMQHESEQIRNFVNGGLYLLLNYKELMVQAKKQHLQQRIQGLISGYNEQSSIVISEDASKTKSDEEKQKHLHTLEIALQPNQQQDQEQGQQSTYVQYNYILKKLRGQIQIDDYDSEQEDQEDKVEMDEFEEQDDQEEEQEDDQDDQSDYIEGQDDYANGEELLVKQYTLVGPEALKEHLLTRSVLDQTAKKINNMTLSMNRSKRLDNIFAQKQKGSQQLFLQPEFDKLLALQNMNISRDDSAIKKKR